MEISLLFLLLLPLATPLDVYSPSQQVVVIIILLDKSVYNSLFQKKQKLEFCLVLLRALKEWYGGLGIPLGKWNIWIFGYLAI